MSGCSDMADMADISTWSKLKSDPGQNVGPSGQTADVATWLHPNHQQVSGVTINSGEATSLSSIPNLSEQQIYHQ